MYVYSVRVSFSCLHASVLFIAVPTNTENSNYTCMCIFPTHIVDFSTVYM